MSRRLGEAAPADARSNGPSRRLVLAGAAATPFSVNAAGASPMTDPAVTACENWLARHAEHERLGQRWQQLESRLAREHNWFKLNRRQRMRFPEAQEMDDLYDRMDVLHDENEILFALLPTIIATTDVGIAAKLAVAAVQVCPDENKEAHQLIASILRDFRAAHGG